MKKDQLSTLIAVGFFAGTFVIAFTSNDSDIAALRVLAYLAIGCFLSLVAIFWDKILATGQEEGHSKIDHVLYDAEKFSEEYGDVYVLADKLKKQRKLSKGQKFDGKAV
ncbi:hypothetical protein [Rufibacter latericius]|uniref:Uncharacterized protein n=1 Tax=Rufibacter latericius TaxID=2487040 RepID=A0A3M9N0T0_9BACT|nr:hypothetical protein [Rufibacter latericius]RNI30618.1 hypothetical protein EFB08_05045 [Rufibacter latericius]